MQAFPREKHRSAGKPVPGGHANRMRLGNVAHDAVHRHLQRRGTWALTRNKLKRIVEKPVSGGDSRILLKPTEVCYRVATALIHRQTVPAA